MLGRGEVVFGVGWGVREKKKMRDAKTCFSAGCTRYTFIISRTFARGRYSLIVSVGPRVGGRDEIIVGIGYGV